MTATSPTLRRGASLRARLRVASAALAVGALAVLAGVVHPSGAAVAAGPTRAAAGAALTASITADDAGVLTPGKDLGVSVTVSNPTDTAFESGTVSLWVDPAAQNDRSALASWLSSTDPVSGAVDLGTAQLNTLEPGSSAVVRVSAPAASLPFAGRTTSAVFGIGATVDAGSSDTTARGSVVWYPGGTAKQASVNVALPIVTPSGTNGIIPADDLATYTAPNGILTRELDGLSGHTTVTVGIDPMIIASIRVLGNAAPASAVDWLGRLADLPNETFSLGYGDADPAGQIQAGLPAPLQPTSLAYAIDPKNFTPAPTPVGEPATASPTPAPKTSSTTPSPTPTTTPGPVLPTMDELLAWDYTLTGVAWPGDKTVRRADLPPLAAAGLKTTIVSGSNTNAADLGTTPNATLSSGDTRILASDQPLSDALRQAISAPSDVAWNSAMSKVNAQLELIAQESGDARRLLVALDRSWPSSGTQFERTLNALFSSPWSAPASFRSVAGAPQTSGFDLVDAPESADRITDISALVQDEGALGQFATVLDDPTTLTGRTRSDLLAVLAVSWLNPRTDWNAAVAKERAATTKTLHSIRILPTENVNLVSAQGSIPFTVSNGLTDEAVTIVLSAAPSNGRLEVDQSTTKRIVKDSRATVLIPVKAKVGNGQVVLSLHLYSPTGVPIGDPTSVTVDVHADWEGIGALIFGILLVLLFGFGIVRNILRRRSKRAEDAADGAADAAGSEAPAESDTDVTRSEGSDGSSTPSPEERPGG
ncbi:DUF6049 family protein [Leifsonia soli]|uniref:2-oxoglutarate dehydrogenase n=1 Tax=Leifsonia soli TaxID=582665 RepID=A0A852T2H8_9MICO|nr:DUF6049 family protein [Leifsonia soli]NYD75377.1 hypothetical protein [Leifsonia soli]